jgi:aminoglycoside phosphotransferase (APT) family kinase protein
MRRQWEADTELNAEQAALLIETQFPRFAPARLSTLGVGWDNVAFVVDEQWVFRFPRRQVAAGLLEREARILPLLAPHLPLRIPAPEYIGMPTAGYPYVFAGYPFIPGRTACRCSCSDSDRAALAPAIARFLAALHHIPIDADTRQWAPGDEIRRANTQSRAPTVKERLVANPAGLDSHDLRNLNQLVDNLATTPANAQQPCWVHGDFYGRHLLLDDTNRAIGVIDWGDVHLGDPAIDLSIAFSFLPPAARRSFRQAYGDIDDATWDRARFRALHYGALLTAYGADTGDTSIQALGEYALRFAPVGA